MNQETYPPEVLQFVSDIVGTCKTLLRYTGFSEMLMTLPHSGERTNVIFEKQKAKAHEYFHQFAKLKQELEKSGLRGELYDLLEVLQTENARLSNIDFLLIESKRLETQKGQSMILQMTSTPESLGIISGFGEFLKLVIAQFSSFIEDSATPRQLASGNHLAEVFDNPLSDTQKKVPNPLNEDDKAILKGLVRLYESSHSVTCRQLHEFLKIESGYVNSEKTVRAKMKGLVSLGYVERPFDDVKFIRPTNKCLDLLKRPT